MVSVVQFPPELFFAICAQVYAAGLPACVPSLDPLVLKDYGIPTALPSSVPPANWSEPLTRLTLANLCLVNHAWYQAAAPWLWRRVEVRLPRSWIALVEEISWNDDDVAVEKTALAVGNSIKAAADAAMASNASPPDKAAALEFEESILASLSGPDSSIPQELLSPPASRDPSPRRLRTKSQSPVRWKIMRSISKAVQNVMERTEPGVYVPTPYDPRPGRFVRHLDFNHFRTIGMRRSVEEGVNSRFVTGDRIEAVLKEMPNLTAFGATEYMDGALTFSVIKELFLRGAPSRGRGRPPRGRVFIINADTNDSVEEEDRERRRECRDLEAVDLTGCVSAVFVNALTEFVTAYLLPVAESNSGIDHEGYGEGRRINNFCRTGQDQPLMLPGIQRLGLRGVKSILPRILTPFVLAFPSLTHLDLSGTRVTPELLSVLGESPTVRLKSLGLARCIRLNGECIKNFLIHSPVTSQITELSLYGDITFTSPLSSDNLRDILALAPCFTSGELVYLDLSSAPLTEALLLGVCRPQPNMRSLGLSYIPNLELRVVSDFLKSKAPNVEVVTLISTSPELDCGRRFGMAAGPRGSPRQASIALHTQVIRPLCTPPFSFNLNSSPPARPPPTKLRVIELSTQMLSGLGAGAGSWRIVRSKGGRGWYVDMASGWVASVGSGQEGSVLRRDLKEDHPLRLEMEKWADANGNVGTGIGWHARKMEILHGYGMLGREDGLYGAVSFAYQG